MVPATVRWRTPERPLGNCRGAPIPYADLDLAAFYSKELFPDLPVGCGCTATWVSLGNTPNLETYPIASIITAFVLAVLSYSLFLR